MTQNGISIWYLTPNSVGKKKLMMKYAIISSPKSFAAGSSLSHLDSQVYSGISSFLMRTSAEKDVSIDLVIPSNRNGLFGDVLLGTLRAMGYVVRQ